MGEGAEGEVREATEEVADKAPYNMGCIGDAKGDLKLASELEEKEDELKGKHSDNKNSEENEGKAIPREGSLPRGPIVAGPK